jgi:tetratricopeptide (TPR) repeat protein
MGFIESLLGSGLANAITLHSVASAFKESRSYPSADASIDASEVADALSQESADQRRLRYVAQRTGIQKELLQRAEKALNEGKYDIALPLLIRALKLDPLYLYYYGALGVCHQNQGKFDIALECYDMALDLADKASLSDLNKYIKSIQSLAKKCEKKLKATTIEVNAVINGVKTDKSGAHKNTFTLASTASCPYCGGQLKKPPIIKTHCPSCKKIIYVWHTGSGDDIHYAVTGHQLSELNKGSIRPLCNE